MSCDLILKCHTSADCPCPTTHRRLNEAHTHWHRALENYLDPDAFRTDLNATIQALRNVTFALQKELAHAPGFDTWYGDWRKAMARSHVMKWVVQARNTVVKEGDLATESRLTASVVLTYHDVARLSERELTDPAADAINLDAPLMSTVNDLLEEVDSLRIPTSVLDQAVLVVERRWVDEQLPDVELLSALAFVFSFLATLVISADLEYSPGSVLPPPDPNTVGFAGDRWPAAGRPPCMVSTSEWRSVRIRLRDGETDVGGLAFGGSPDPATMEEAARRYGFDGTPVPQASDNCLELVPYFADVASSILRAGEEHGWFVMYFQGPAMIDVETLYARDRADKWTLAQRVARRAAELNADGVVHIGENWLAPPQVDQEGAFVPPAEHAERREAVVVVGELANGLTRSIVVIFERDDDGNVRVEAPVEQEVTDNFLMPVRAVWAANRAPGADSRDS